MAGPSPNPTSDRTFSGERPALARRRKVVAAASAEHGGEPIPVVTLPVNTRPLGPLPEARKQALREHVRTLLGEVHAESPGEVRHWPRSRTRLPLAGRACELCRGACCNDGRETAFLARATIREFLHQHPDAEPEDVVAAYAAWLPAESYVESCVFHAADGCALPRELRSDICNRHLCTSLLEAEDLDRAYAVAVDGAGQVRDQELIGDD